MDIAHCHLDGNADAVEFCPHESFDNILAACTYTLQEGDQPRRTGSISLFDVDADSSRLSLIHRVQTAGIFDIKWSPFGATVGPLLAQAGADGYVRVHKLESCSDESQVPGGHGFKPWKQPLAEMQGNSLLEVSDEQVSSSMCLCIDWNPSATSLAVGLSDGSVSIISFLESQLSISRDWKAHDFELWAASFDIQQPQLVYTGSDDCKFSCWDMRDEPNFAFQNRKAHTMGICCITKSPSDPYTLLTGSYDEHLRVWDVRSIAKPVHETSISLGGGVWRIKYHPSVPDLVLTACMHNGFAVVKVKDDKAEVLETYNKHGSLAYGADWQRGCLGRKNNVIATCSFYDRLLRVWKPEGDIQE
ncbi:putative WD repeat-containing protein 85 isoform 1 [Capsicum annuum]|nr:putative WD repeat-containing protein 85 isoform 1 [Capsicum annuum]